MADPKPKKTAKADLKKQEILEGARALFESRGFTETSMLDIAQAAGLRREGLYYYYPSRGEILLDLIKPQNESLNAGLEAVINANARPVTKLYLALRNHILLFDRTALDFLVTGVRGLARDEQEFVHQKIKPLYKSYEEKWGRLIEEGIEADVFRPVDNPKIVVFGIVGMCNWLTAWFDPTGPVKLVEIVRVFYDLIAGGLVDTSRAHRPSRREIDNFLTDCAGTGEHSTPSLHVVRKA